MITIFQGRKISLDGTEDEIYAQVAVSLRGVMHYFNDGRTLNPFAIFMCIALHADKNGWAYPGRNKLSKSTGLSTDEAISNSVRHLRNMTIGNHRVLAMYRQKQDGNRWGLTVYRIFPDAFGDEMASAPVPSLVEWNPEKPPPVNPGVGKPGMGNPPSVNPGLYKDNHIEGDPSEVSGLSGAKPSDNGQTQVSYYYRDKKHVDACGKVGSPPWKVVCVHCQGDVVVTERDRPFECQCAMFACTLLSRRPDSKPKRGHPAVEAYYLIANRKQGTIAKEWEDEIAQTVGDEPEALSFWRLVVKEYCGRGWNRGEVAKMLNYHKEQRLPGTRKKRLSAEGGESKQLINTEPAWVRDLAMRED